MIFLRHAGTESLIMFQVPPFVGLDAAHQGPDPVACFGQLPGGFHAGAAALAVEDQGFSAEQVHAVPQALVGDADGAFDVPAAEVPGRADVNEDIVGFKEIAVYFPGGDGAKVHGITF